MAPSEKIPADLRDALDEALEALAGWPRNGPDPVVSWNGRQTPIETVFRLVESSSEPAPEDICDAAFTLASVFRSGPEAAGHACRGPKDDSYASVSECLIALYAARQDRYRRRGS
jgi:hypothetical protein